MAEETAQEDSGDIRRKAFVRLGIAAVVTALALGALWWLDNSGKPASKPKPASPAPIVAAPTRQPPAEPQPTVEPQPAPEIPAPPPPQEAAPTTPPPPPKVNEAPAPQAPHAAAPAPRRSGESAPAPQATARPPSAPAAAEDHYVVQIGVFTNLAHAQELVDRLNKQGIHAYTETRVHVGPFASRAEAEKAQATLKKLGITGLIAQPAATK